MSSILPIILLGDPVLRQQALPIDTQDPFVRQLVDDMIATLEDSGGIGLAAPQVGVASRVFLTKVPEGDHLEEPGVLRVFINPKLKKIPSSNSSMEEGCLSIPNIRIPVTRPDEIEVEWSDLEGVVHADRFLGLEARCIMHENDHLNGVLIIDRAPDSMKGQLKKWLKNR